MVALLVREERARVKADESLTTAKRDEELKRLDGLATVLAKTAARDTSLLALLAEDARVSASALDYKHTVLKAAGREVADSPEPPAPSAPTPAAANANAVVPQSAVSYQMANPFLAPDFSAVRNKAVRAGRLSRRELLDPLFRSFERDAPGAQACMTLPDAAAAMTSAPGLQGRTLMPHQAQAVASVERGHRTFLLADEPGLGKTAQALLAAQAADAYPLLVIAPNVVKMNWAKEVEPVDPAPPGQRGARRRRRRRCLRGRGGRELRHPRSPRGLVRWHGLPRHGGR
ncbi:hypothetical protein GCM10025876_02950 [Demequina litorisediminis]|uniref:SNF2 N-terminal domain-containing protein n=1 Tax=Demequina litorisediminis TaxID=1849022 RepID=A0ABQ6I8S0_9MICO|nr:hypothetical protein GCM10025876_02950 [Demequina litorisediminis]